MYIVPLSSSIIPLNVLSQNEALGEEAKQADVRQPSFADVFREVMGDVTDTQQTLNEDAARLIMGDIDDLHTIYNNMTKAEIAIETFIAVKDTCQQSFNELMQMSI